MFPVQEWLFELLPSEWELRHHKQVVESASALSQFGDNLAKIEFLQASSKLEIARTYLTRSSESWSLAE